MIYPKLNTVITNVTISHSQVTGLDGSDRGAGLAIQTNPPIEKLNSHQVWLIAQKVKECLDGMVVEVE